MPLIALPRRIYWGEKAGDAVKSIIQEHGLNTVLVVSDPVVSRLDAYREVTGAVEEAGARLLVYERVPPEPPTSIGDEIAGSLPQGSSVDAIIAVGGGSVIDAGKALQVRLLRPDVGIEDVAPFNPLGVELKRPLLIAVPTTAGTGSDASYGIVLTKEDSGRRVKIDVASHEVIPYATILDPRLPAGAPRSLLLGAALDALGHALEALVANQSNPLTDALAEKTIEEVMVSLPRAASGDEEAVARIHLAATMAGIAFTNGGLGLIHAVAHPLGATLRLHHGTVVGIVAPRVVEYNMRDPELASKYDRVKRVMELIHGWQPRGSLAEHILSLYEEVGFPHRLREYGVSESLFREAKSVVLDEAYHDPSIAFARLIPSPDELGEMLDGMY